MKNFKFIFLLFISVIIFMIIFKDSKLSYFEMRGNPYYQNPQKTKVDLNTINIYSPSLKKYFGETYLAKDMAEYFRSKGKKVNIRSIRNYYNKTSFDQTGTSINIFFYGALPVWPNKNGINIVYQLYPVVVLPSFDGHDLVVAASKRYASFLSDKGYPAIYLPQFTNPDRFKSPKKRTKQTNLLFIGNAVRIKDDFRPSVKYALENDMDIAVYGKSWKKYIPKKYIKGEFISNDELYRYYSSADIVLNDHRPDMIENGFVSNRIFDVTASGGFVISDYMPEIEEIYGDSIPMYHDSEDFGKIVRYYLDHPKERQQKASKAHDITLKNFTLDKIGQRFLEEIDKIVEKRKAEGTIILAD